MFLVLLVLFLVAPLVEITTIVRVGQSIGVLETVGLLIVMTVVGAWLARVAGLGVLNRIQRTVRQGKVPSAELVDGGLVLFAGALMIVPGFVSDLLAILLLLPPTRAVVRGVVLRKIRARGGFVDVIAGPGSVRRPGARPQDEVWDVESWEDPPERPGLGR